MTGPVPKRSEERRRRNARTEAGASTEVEKLEAPGSVDAPEPDEDWHPIALGLYRSVEDSAFRRFYEPSDWMVLFLTCESLSRDLGEQVVGITEQGDVVRDTIPLKGASLTAYSRVFASLLLTDGDRRKLRLEIDRRDALEALEKALPDVVKDRADIFLIKGGAAG